MATDEDGSARGLKTLTDGFERNLRERRGTMNYVAKPADGWNTAGLWHCFDTAGRTGYAAHAVALHWLLAETMGVPTQLVPHRNLDIDIERFPPDRYEMLFRWHKAAVGYPHALFCSFPLEVAAELSEMGPPLIPYCAFEGTRVSPFVRDLCNSRAFEQVWVVSDFVARVLVMSGVRQHRVHVVRPAIVPGVGPWASMGRGCEELRSWSPLPVSESAPFTFGAMGTWHERKGFHDLLRAYFRGFSRDEPVKLVIRTSVFGRNVTIREFKERLTGDIAAIAAEFGDTGFPESRRQPRLELILGTEATDAEVIDWLGRDVDCYVNATYGEGLGIPHIWAKAQGVPMVSSDYGAVGELLVNLRTDARMGPEETVDEIFPHKLVTVPEEMCQVALSFDRQTQWGGYEVADLADSMRAAFAGGRVTDPVGAAIVRELYGSRQAKGSALVGLGNVLSGEALEACGL